MGTFVFLLRYVRLSELSVFGRFSPVFSPPFCGFLFFFPLLGLAGALQTDGFFVFVFAAARTCFAHVTGCAKSSALAHETYFSLWFECIFHGLSKLEN